MSLAAKSKQLHVIPDVNSLTNKLGRFASELVRDTLSDAVDNTLSSLKNNLINKLSPSSTGNNLVDGEQQAIEIIDIIDSKATTLDKEAVVNPKTESSITTSDSGYNLESMVKEYETLSEKARFDKTFESDYQAAFRVPAIFMFGKAASFEQTFDKIIYHLDESYRKCIDSNMREIISRSSEDLFHQLIYVFQTRLDALESQNTKGLIQKLSESINNICSSISSMTCWNNKVQMLAPEVGNLTVSFLNYLYSSWELKREESFFYNQLSNIYQKLLSSKCFNNKYGLVRNTFASNKGRILKYVLQEKGVTAASNLMKYDETNMEQQDSARIIVHSMLGIDIDEKFDWKNKVVNIITGKSKWDKCDWDKCADFLANIKTLHLDNFNELQHDLLHQYAEFLSFLKTSEGKKHPSKIIKKKYPTQKALWFKSEGDLNGLNKYMVKRKIVRWIIIALIPATFLALSIIGCFVGPADACNYNKKLYHNEYLSVQAID